MYASVDAQNATKESVTLKGQVVCSLCSFEADRTTTPFETPHDLECALECAEKGIPSAIAVAEGGDFNLYILTEGKIKSDKWLNHIGKQVELAGHTYSKEDKLFITVDELKESVENHGAQTRGRELELQPELILSDLSGGEQRLSSYRGRIVVLNFWATWCTPCRQEMPDLVAIQNDYAALGVQVIGAAADSLEDRAKVMQFIKETRVNFPIWLGTTTTDLGRFGLGPALPGTVILDRDGKIVLKTHEVVNPAELRKTIDGLLSVAMIDLERKLAAKDATPSETSVVPS